MDPGLRLLPAQRRDGVEPGCLPGRIEAEAHAGGAGHARTGDRLLTNGTVDTRSVAVGAPGPGGARGRPFGHGRIGI